jgi:hypothetical protein
MDDFFPADEESVEVVMKEKENAGEDQRKQERNFKDGISVHGSVTGLTVDLFSLGSTQRRDPSAPGPFAGKDLPCKLTKRSAIVKRDIWKPRPKGGASRQGRGLFFIAPLIPACGAGLAGCAPGQTKQLTPDFRL